MILVLWNDPCKTSYIWYFYQKVKLQFCRMSSVVCCTDDEAFPRVHCPIEVLIDNKWQFMSSISDVHPSIRRNTSRTSI